MIYDNIMLHAISTSMCLSISNSKATIMIQVKTPPDSYNTLKLISTCFTCAYELKTASYIPAAQTARGKSSRPNTWSSL